MIGPHEGIELKLLLEGQKFCALFHDLLPENGAISEKIIPERKFAPYVRSGQIIRITKDILNTKGETIRYVSFCIPGHEWRGEFLLWLAEQRHQSRISYNQSHEYIIGNLLGYSDEDIRDFVKK